MNRSMKGISVKEVARLLGKSIASEEVITGYAIDSRAVMPGNLFFALSGKKVDGCQFLKDVAEKGAIASIVPQNYQGENFGLILIYVEDVRASLQHLASIAFSKRKEKVVGVTGSVGKTTTKEFLAHLLEAKYQVFKTAGTFNSQVTFPLSLLNMEGEFDILVLEMGMSEPGEIRRLVQIAPPDIAIITRISYAHAQFFPDGLNGIAAAKAEILSGNKTALAVMSTQTAEFQEIVKDLKCRKITYSLSDHADYRLYPELVIEEKGKKGNEFSLPFFASHLQENFLAAYAVCRELGMEVDEIIAKAQTLKTYPLRFEIVQKDGVTYVKDCYNANPESMRAALQNLPQPETMGRVWAVLGSMRPLGKFSEKCHLELGELAFSRLDQLLCIGTECLPIVDLFRRSGKKAEFFSDLKVLKSAFENNIQKGDVVLIKGSNDHALWKLFED